MLTDERKVTYEWEDAFIVQYDKFVPTVYLEFVFNMLCDAFGVVGASLQFNKSGEMSYCKTDIYEMTHEIVIIPAHQKISILLHEFSHVLVHNRFMGTVKEHGPEWLTTYMILLNNILEIPLDYMIMFAQKMGLEFYESAAKSASRYHVCACTGSSCGVSCQNCFFDDREGKGCSVRLQPVPFTSFG